MANTMLEHIEVKDDLLDDERYLYLYSVEVVNDMVMQGIPFREAYVQVGKAIESGEFKRPENVSHSHEGSLGQLCLDEIQSMMNENLSKFPFEHIEAKIKALIEA